MRTLTIRTLLYSPSGAFYVSPYVWANVEQSWRTWCGGQVKDEDWVLLSPDQFDKLKAEHPGLEEYTPGEWDVLGPPLTIEL